MRLTGVEKDRLDRLAFESGLSLTQYILSNCLDDVVCSHDFGDYQSAGKVRYIDWANGMACHSAHERASEDIELVVWRVCKKCGEVDGRN